jgi:hypothetical protein
MAETIDDNPEHTVDDKMLKTWRDSGKLSEEGYNQTIKRVKAYATSKDQAHQKSEKEDFQIAMMEADTPPTDALTIQDWAAKQKENGLGWTNPAYRLRLNEFIDRKVEGVMKKGEAEEKPVEKQTFDAMREDREKGGSFIPLITSTQRAPWYEFWKGSTATTGQFDGSLTAFRKQLSGMSTDDIKAAFGPDATAKKVIDAEQLQFATKMAKMRDWFKANPETTVEQADEYRQSLEQPEVMDAVKQAIVAGPSIDASDPAINLGKYDTKLSPKEEQQFQEWKHKYAPNDDGNDYDLRGAFKAGFTPAKNGHWRDDFKKPTHRTFSDQSIYAKDRPDLAGHWDGDTYVPPKDSVDLQARQWAYAHIDDPRAKKILDRLGQ